MFGFQCARMYRSQCGTRLRRRLCYWCGSWSYRNMIDGTRSSSLSLADRDWSWGELRERSSRIDKVHLLSQQWCHRDLKGRIKIILIQHYSILLTLISHNTENQTEHLKEIQQIFHFGINGHTSARHLQRSSCIRYSL